MGAVSAVGDQSEMAMDRTIRSTALGRETIPSRTRLLYVEGATTRHITHLQKNGKSRHAFIGRQASRPKASLNSISQTDIPMSRDTKSSECGP